MSGPPGPRPEPLSLLQDVSTRWPLITDPLQFVLRYAPAVRRYLAALVKDPHDAEDVAQQFLLRATARPFTPDQVRGGRFRDYLKAVLRNEALTHFRRRARRPADSANLDLLPAPEVESDADRAWRAEWRDCLLRRAWDGLEQHQRDAPDGLAYTALRLAADHPGEDSVALASRASAQTGRTIRPDAFRKQLSRARRRFAQLIVNEIRRTLERPDAETVVEELRDLGLMEHVREFLPAPYRG
ncbi:MAG TPA: sigma factor [Gemmataceae bacterium]|nr:sigma factor [Gemmataceae bacterium]